MANHDLELGSILAEILRLQLWAGSDTQLRARVFGLLHGFQSVMNKERVPGISEDTQRKVEYLLEDVEAGKQSTDGPAIKDRLYGDGVSESDAANTMQLCVLQSRFGEGVNKVMSGRGSVFAYLKATKSLEAEWHGALHYVELVDSTDGARKKLHAVFTPSVPRVGEIVVPPQGSRMKVVEVEHLMVQKGGAEGSQQSLLVPYVVLQAMDDETEDTE